MTRRLAAEFLGTAFLLAAVVGSGIMGERLCGGNIAIALLANSAATGAALVALILALGPVSGGHFNPAVTLMAVIERTISRVDAVGYVLVQITGAFLGVVVAHAMFGESAFDVSSHERSGLSQALSEFVATFGLLMVIAGVSRTRPAAVPYAVAAYITAAYWFTASTSFANPAVTLARSMTDTFSGIHPADVPMFVAAQLIAGLSMAITARWIFPPDDARSRTGESHARIRKTA